MVTKTDLLSIAASTFIRALFKTCRIETYGEELNKELLSLNNKPIYAAHHRGIIYHAFNLRDRKTAAMVSPSSDGDLMSSLLSRFGFLTPRGSSSRKGRQALAELEKLVKAGHPAVLATDGPTGPPYVSKIGVIILAARTGSPVFPYAWDAYPSIELNSWDRTILPLPFSRIVVAYDRSPMYIEDGLDRDDYESLRKEYDSRINTLNYQVRYCVKNGIRGMDPREIEVPENYLDLMPRRSEKKRSKRKKLRLLLRRTRKVQPGPSGKGQYPGEGMSM